MSMTSVHAGAPRRRSLGLDRVLMIWIARLRERWRVRREMAALSDLPGYLRRDVGFEEYIERRKGPYPPTRR